MLKVGFFREWGHSLWLLLLYLFVVASADSNALRVMSFNLWHSGRRVDGGCEKIARHILKVDADIVGFQVGWAEGGYALGFPI